MKQSTPYQASRTKNTGAQKPAIIVIGLSVIVLIFAAVMIFSPLGQGLTQGTAGARVATLSLVALVLVLVNILLVSYLTFVVTGVILRQPQLMIKLENDQADGRPLLLARRENVIQVSLVNVGPVAAKYIHAAFRWSGEGQISLRGPSGAYLDRRFWTEGEGRLRLFTGGLDRVVLSSRQIVIAELHVSNPESPIRFGYRVFCEDMDEIQGEAELNLKDID